MAYDPPEIHMDDVEEDADDAEEEVVLQMVFDDDEDFLLGVLLHDSNSFHDGDEVENDYENGYDSKNENVFDDDVRRMEVSRNEIVIDDGCYDDHVMIEIEMIFVVVMMVNETERIVLTSKYHSPYSHPLPQDLVMTASFPFEVLSIKLITTVP